MTQSPVSQLELENTLSAFYRWEKEKAHQPFLRQPYGNDWKEYTWHNAGEQIRKMAAYLKRELPANSKVALLSYNCSHWVMADLAIMLAGHISVPIYPSAGSDTITTILEHSESKLAFIGKYPEWDKKSDTIPEDVQLIGCHQHHTEMKDWDEIIAGEEPYEDSPVPDMDELATIIYTSGTTGMPKGVMITHKILSNGAAAASAFIDLKDERCFSYLPLAHCAERELTEIISIHTGSTISFTESLEMFQENIRSVKPTIFFGVPRIWLKFQHGIEEQVGKAKLKILLKIPFLNSLIRKKILKGLGLEEAKICLSGAAGLPRGTSNFFRSIGIKICEAYGLTETMAFSHASIPDKWKAGSVGVTLPTAEAKIAESGEILLRSPCIMKGYYKEPLKTAEVLDDDGFFHTGDLGRIDDDGFLFITGRLKDIFKTSKGKYVTPAPIEATLEPELGVEHLCVIGDGLPSPVAVASIYNKQFSDKKGYHDEAVELLKMLNNKLESHEKLAKLILVDEEWNTENGLITPTLKIRRQQIEDRYKGRVEKHLKSDDLVIWD
ncbi:AMP-binding protein [Kangiella sediminilitoris]|uniref:AMP-dependent synthetase and ligase n=1 Tax=Kangiella sediminilitoris TaxID=1144748 RepID=A0A1B3BAU0_9GAMM|nr:AMP-binding protein [Kangiella sediminilitoris]AOE49909.1 AMP-dependent synthetase and ligase [Kangiella sediminilitoris]